MTSEEFVVRGKAKPQQHRRAGKLRRSALLTACSAIALFSAAFFGSSAAHAQITSLLNGQTSTTSATATKTPADSLGRETPRGTVVGFLRAAQDENYPVAEQYFQPTPSTSRHRPRPDEEEELVRQLLAVLNQKLHSSTLDQLSRDPQGKTDDGLPADEDLLTNSGTTGPDNPQIYLVREEDEHGNKLWYISRKTLDQVPEMFDALHFSTLERHLPETLKTTRILSMPLWQWLAILLFVPVAVFLGWLLVFIGRLGRRAYLRRRGREPQHPASLTRIGPLALLFAALFHQFFVYLIGTSVLYREYYRKIIWVFLAAAFYWAVIRATRVISNRVSKQLTSSGRLAERSMVSLIRRVLEVLIFIFVGLTVLSTLGVNVTTALAGLGIGGLAVGLGAQKTFENLLGGISILFDKALQVGDTCKIGDQTGTVEDIGLRSTKIRTADRTLVSVPNGTVATATLENFRQRDKILSKQIVRLRYDLSPDHLRYALEQIREVVKDNQRVEANSARVRLLRFNDYSIDVEMFLYILTRDYNEFMAIQEGLLLDVLDRIDHVGASIALPSQSTIVTKDSWVDPERAKAAHDAMRKANDGEAKSGTPPDTSNG